MLDIYSQFIKDSENQSLYQADENILANEEDEEKRLEAEKLEIERIRESEQERLETIQQAEQIQEPAKLPQNIYEEFIKDSGEQDTDLSLENISTSRRIKYGAAQEPTIFGNIYRLGRAGVESLINSS